jgi:hypothetical protein
MTTELPNNFNFNGVSLEDLFLMVYFFVDEWSKIEGDKFRSPGRPVVKLALYSFFYYTDCAKRTPNDAIEAK